MLEVAHYPFKPMQCLGCVFSLKGQKISSVNLQCDHWDRECYYLKKNFEIFNKSQILKGYEFIWKKKTLSGKFTFSLLIFPSLL